MTVRYANNKIVSEKTGFVKGVSFRLYTLCLFISFKFINLFFMLEKNANIIEIPVILYDK